MKTARITETEIARLRAENKTLRTLLRAGVLWDRSLERLDYPNVCAICGAPVTLNRRQDRWQARKRGFAYCSRACSDAGRAASIQATKVRTRAARLRAAS
jgi:hypothetical protein